MLGASTQICNCIPLGPPKSAFFFQFFVYLIRPITSQISTKSLDMRIWLHSCSFQRFYMYMTSLNNRVQYWVLYLAILTVWMSLKIRQIWVKVTKIESSEVSLLFWGKSTHWHLGVDAMWQTAPSPEQLVDRGTDLHVTPPSALYKGHFCVPKPFKLHASLINFTLLLLYASPNPCNKARNDFLVNF